LADSKGGLEIIRSSLAGQSSTGVLPLRFQLPPGIIARVRKVAWYVQHTGWARTTQAAIDLAISHRVLNPNTPNLTNLFTLPEYWAMFQWAYTEGSDVGAEITPSVVELHFDPGYDVPGSQSGVFNISNDATAAIGVAVYYEHLKVGEAAKQQLMLRRSPRQTQDILG